MRIHSYSFSALVATTILLHPSFAGGGHVSRHHRRVRSINAGIDELNNLHRRAAVNSVQISMSELQSLQSYTTTYHGWMIAWLNQQPPGSSSAAQLKEQYQLFDGWVNTWLLTAMSNSPSSANLSTPPPFASYTPTLDQSAGQSPPSARSSRTSSPAPVSTAGSQTSPPRSVSRTSPMPISGSIEVSATASAPSPSASSFGSISSVATAISPSQTGNSSTGAGLDANFNPQASNNIAVYWGATAAARDVDLAETCQDPNVDIVLLAFLTNYNGPGGYPSVDFVPGCDGQTIVQQQEGAAGLLYCEKMAQAIQGCQKKGKKFLLSMGGAAADKNLDFRGEEDANKAAKMMSNLFAGGKDLDEGLRPFGGVKLDGFDLDNESHSHTQISTFVKVLREELDKDTSKKYYITAAPQCPRPDESIPLDAMQLMDFVWVQFYNNVQSNCNANQPGFSASFEAWTKDLSANGAGPKLYIGIPGCGGDLCASSGYVEPDAVPGVVKSVQAAKSLGGIMMWDGPRAKLNKVGSKNFLDVVKGALGS